jgi:hypothetical protein
MRLRLNWATTMSLPHRSNPPLWRFFLHHWDALVSLLATVGFWLVMGLSSRPIGGEVIGLLAAAISLGSASSAAAFVAGRWVSDRLSKDEYGTLILAIDPRESRVQRPYLIVTYVGLGTAALGVFLAVTLGEFPRSITVFLYGALFGLSLYCLLGLASLVRITTRHQSRAAVLRAHKEQEERERRLRRVQQEKRGDGFESR